MNDKNQGTVIGIVCIVLMLVPVLGIIANILTLKRFANDTNANTCAMIGIVLSWIVTVLFVVGGGFYAFVYWSFSSWGHH